MAVDIQFYLSSYTAGGAISLGGAITGTLAPQTLNGLFDFISPTEASIGNNDHHCIWAKNNSATDTAYGGMLYISQLTTKNPDTIVYLAYDPVGTQTIASEDTPPVGLTFTAATIGTPISLGDIAPLGSKMIWIKWFNIAGVTKIPADAGQLTIKYGTSV